jgi:2-oxoglutarate ferredoxin oxidoreductase subunit gamma
MARTEIRITGLGGQGVILLGYVLGKAAALHGDRHAVMTQSFGPEARGSACSAQVVVDEERIAYPYPIHPQHLIALSQDGYDLHIDQCAENAMVFIDSDLVEPKSSQRKHLLVQATRIAEDVGRRILLNMVMLGFFGRHSNILDVAAFRSAIAGSVPPGTEEMNLAAFERGWEASA